VRQPVTPLQDRSIEFWNVLGLIRLSTTEDQRDAAQRELGQHGIEASDLVPDDCLIQWLRSANPTVYGRAELVLESRTGPATITALRGLASDPNVRVRLSAVSILTSLGCSDARAVREIARYLKDKNPRVRALAAQALSGLGANARGVELDLMRYLSSRNDEGQLWCALTLAGLGVSTEQAFGVITNQSPQVFVSRMDFREVTQALARMGPAAKPAVPLLQACLEVPNPAANHLAASTVWMITGEASLVVPVFDGAITNPSHSGLLFYNLKALSKIGPAARGKVPNLVAAFTVVTKAADPFDAAMVRSALRAIDPELAESLEKQAKAVP
jgi:HEAT repeat protein